MGFCLIDGIRWKTAENASRTDQRKRPSFTKWFRRFPMHVTDHLNGGRFLSFLYRLRPFTSRYIRPGLERHQEIIFSNDVQFLTTFQLHLNHFEFFFCFLIFLPSFPWFLREQQILFSSIKIYSFCFFDIRNRSHLKTTQLLNMVAINLFSPTTYTINLIVHRFIFTWTHFK